MAKEPVRRIQSALDLRNEIEEVKQELGSGEAPGAAIRLLRRRWLAPALLAAIAVVGVAAIASRLWLRPARAAVPRLGNPVQLTSASGVEDYPTWSGDGRTLAFAGSEGLTSGNWDIWVTQLGLGQPVNRTADFKGRDCCPSWSPDGSQIAFWSDREGGGYFVMSALGGPARKVMTAVPDVYRYSAPQWSADGGELAGLVVDSTGFFVEIVSMTTQQSRRLTLPGRTSDRMDLSWSPDGRFFAYVDGGGGHEVTGLWVLRQADAQTFPVTDGRTKVWGPNWSADGRRLNFVSNRGGSMDLWQQLLGRDGKPDGDPQPVTVGIGIRHAAFSRDGRKLAYSRGRSVSNLWRAPILDDRPATWADAQQLTFDQAYLEYFDVSPDGERVLFSSDRGGNMDLWTFPVSGGDMTQVTSDPTPDWYPKWSPDGKEIVFYSFRSGNREIWVMPVGGGPARQLTEGKAAGVESWFPAWSPNGQEIAFSSTEGVNANIDVIGGEGGKTRRLTKPPGLHWRPIWSPDGAWLAFTSDHVLWRVPAAGGEPELLSDGPAEHPLWSRDGKRIFYVSLDEKSGNIWALSLRDRSVRLMTDLRGRHGSLLESLASDGQYFYFAWHEDNGDIWVMDVATDESE